MQGLRREEVAERLGVSLKTVGNWERSEVPQAQEAVVRQALFVDNPLGAISDLALVTELLNRLNARHAPLAGEHGRWLASYGPPEEADDDDNGGNGDNGGSGEGMAV